MASETLADAQFDMLEAAYSEVPIEAKARIAELESLVDGNTRWHELFGTPEKVADYFATQCMGGDAYTCEICPFADCNGGLHVATHPTIRNELLEWLRGDAE